MHILINQGYIANLIYHNINVNLMIMYKKYVVLQYWGKYNYQKNEFATLILIDF